jgi:hypothetical protein
MSRRGGYFGGAPPPPPPPMYICCALVSSSPSVARFFVSSDFPRADPDVGNIVFATYSASASSAESQLLSHLGVRFLARPDVGRGAYEGDLKSLSTFAQSVVLWTTSATDLPYLPPASSPVPAASSVASADAPADPVDAAGPTPPTATAGPPPPAPPQSPWMTRSPRTFGAQAGSAPETLSLLQRPPPLVS